mgnify:FL=1
MVVIGAGFGGLAAAKGLADEPVDVTVIDANNFHTFVTPFYCERYQYLSPSSVASV